MKHQLGLLHTDGRPATPDDMDMLLGELGDTPAETSGEVINDSLVMAYRGDRLTREEDSERQPLDQGLRILTWDGRLDNREELVGRLGLAHLRDIPDPAIVLKSYEAFGQSVFRDLVGEFALTLWCKSTKTLRFARSACGARPLYYTLTKGTLYWSSDFAHLVRISEVDLDINEIYVVEYLLSQPSTKHSPLSNVKTVPANQLIHFQNGRVQHVCELWNPTSIRMLQYRTDHEYEEHCREKLTEAVRVRLRAKTPVFAELSGGLDSSSIVLTADRILKAKNEPVENLQTVSCVYEQSQTCDERNFIRLVEESRGVETLLVWEQTQRVTLGLQNPEFTGLPNPLHCSPGRYPAFATLMREHKARVLLTGLGGDHLFWSAPDGAPLIADELRQVNFLRAHRECRTWCRAAGLPYLQLMLKKALPLAVGGPYQVLERPNWLRQRTGRHSQDLLRDQPKHASPSRRAQLFSIDLLSRTVGAGYFNDYKDLYVSHPYTHRPLLEFCLAAPLSQFLRAGQTRSLMRRALAELLPPKIVKRVSKGMVDEAIVRALQREWPDNLDLGQWQVCTRGFVDPDQLSDSLFQMRLGSERLSGPLMRLFSIERWLQSLGRIPASNIVRNRTCALSLPRQ